jgi:hypothetical protein
MKIYNPDELAKILEAHRNWIRGEEGGERADLSRANLYGADLYGAAHKKPIPQYRIVSSIERPELFSGRTVGEEGK